MDRGAWRAVVHGVKKELDMIEQRNNNDKNNQQSFLLTSTHRTDSEATQDLGPSAGSTSTPLVVRYRIQHGSASASSSEKCAGWKRFHLQPPTSYPQHPDNVSSRVISTLLHADTLLKSKRYRTGTWWFRQTMLLCMYHTNFTVSRDNIIDYHLACGPLWDSYLHSP